MAKPGAITLQTANDSQRRAPPCGPAIAQGDKLRQTSPRKSTGQTFARPLDVADLE